MAKAAKEATPKKAAKKQGGTNKSAGPKSGSAGPKKNVPHSEPLKPNYGGE